MCQSVFTIVQFKTDTVVGNSYTDYINTVLDTYKIHFFGVLSDGSSNAVPRATRVTMYSLMAALHGGRKRQFLNMLWEMFRLKAVSLR